MKHLSIVFFSSILVSTWCIVHSDPPIPFETHVAIQSELNRLLLSSLRVNRPDITDAQVDRVWTEPYGSGKPLRLKVHFEYHFTAPSIPSSYIESSPSLIARSILSADAGSGSENPKGPTELVHTKSRGEGVFEKKISDGNKGGTDNWVLSNVKVTSSTLTYEQAQPVTTGKSSRQEEKK